MNTKLANIGASVLIGGFGVWLLIMSRQLKDPGFSQIGSGYYPGLLSVILIILALINLIKNMVSKNNDKLELPQSGRIWLTIVLTALFFISWDLFGFFYLQTFIYLLVLFTIYRLPLGMKPKVIGMNVAVALILTLVMYLIFNVFMYVNF